MHTESNGNRKLEFLFIFIVCHLYRYVVIFSPNLKKYGNIQALVRYNKYKEQRAILQKP